MHDEGRVVGSNYAEVSPRERDVVADEVAKILGDSSSFEELDLQWKGRYAIVLSLLCLDGHDFSSSYLAATVSQPQKYVDLKS